MFLLPSKRKGRKISKYLQILFLAGKCFIRLILSKSSVSSVRYSSSVRERFTKLYKDFLEKEKKEKRDSGVDVEYNENQELLTDYHELILDWEKEREEKVDNKKAVAEEMRRKAMEVECEEEKKSRRG